MVHIDLRPMKAQTDANSQSANRSLQTIAVVLVVCATLCNDYMLICAWLGLCSSRQAHALLLLLDCATVTEHNALRPAQLRGVALTSDCIVSAWLRVVQL